MKTLSTIQATCLQAVSSSYQDRDLVVHVSGACRERAQACLARAFPKSTAVARVQSSYVPGYKA